MNAYTEKFYARFTVQTIDFGSNRRLSDHKENDRPCHQLLAGGPFNLGKKFELSSNLAMADGALYN